MFQGIIWNNFLILLNIFFLASAIWFSSPVVATFRCGTDFSFASYYADYMVLQRAPIRAKVWGYGVQVADNVTVMVEGQGQQKAYNAVTKQGTAGRPIWSVSLDPMETGGPYAITASSRNCSVKLTDVLIGDVWICSGQSNMGFSLGQMYDSKEEIDNVVNYPNVRVFQNALHYSKTPLEDVMSVSQQWSIPVPSHMKTYSAVCWLYGRHLYDKYKRPIGLVETCWGGTRIEAWSPPEALNNCFPHGPTNETGQNGASVLYNAMIHPFFPMPIYGAIWYQGEANIYNYQSYGCAIQQMVKYWRMAWHTSSPTMDSQFPFGEVQLAPKDNNDTNRGTTGVRWAQSRGYGYVPNSMLPRFFMAVTIDTPDFYSPYGDVHVRFKRPAAYRLALAGFAVAYGDESEGLWQGPIPTAFKLNGNNLDITLSNGTVALQTRDTEHSTHYEVCCSASPKVVCREEDNDTTAQWRKTKITSVASGHVTVLVPCDLTSDVIVGVRYAWRESPCLVLERCAIYSEENNLPAPPFFYTGLIQ